MKKLIIYILAVYALTRSVLQDRGPFGFIVKTKEFFGSYHHELSEITKCPYCLSFWLSIVIAMSSRFVTKILAIWGGVSLIFTLIEILQHLSQTESEPVDLSQQTESEPKEDCGCNSQD